MKTINGDTRRYLLINTTRYNDDGKYNVIDCGYAELFELGFNVEDKKMINRLEVDSILTTDFVGAYLMRVA